MQAAHGAFCITGFGEPCGPERALQHAVHLAEAARRAGVRHVIWSTLEDTRRFLDADGHHALPLFESKGGTDPFFIQRGLPLTRLLTAFCWDRLLDTPMGPQREADGRLALVLPLGPARLPGIAVQDIGACAAALFRQGGAALGRRVGIAGEHLDGDQMAAAFARALGEPVRHVAVDPADYARRDIPGAAPLADMFRFVRDFNDEVCAVRDVAATRALHPALMRFDDFVARHASRLPTARRAA
jgi:uncharacterized protein YbjT (DUF2867 family)